jgi:hypothetical protein
MTTVEHPPWCHRPTCTVTANGASGSHQSTTVVVRRNGGSDRTELFLEQSVVAGAHLLLIVERYVDDESEPDMVVAWRLNEARRVVERMGGLLALVGAA